MQYRPLGRSGLKVSPLCLGTMNFGPHTTEPDSFAIMDKALEVGINFFDTADVYGWKRGEGVTEQIVGRWFAQGGGRREKVVIATKVFGDMDRESNPDPNLDGPIIDVIRLKSSISDAAGRASLQRIVATADKVMASDPQGAGGG